ncbi:MAG TPA: glycosyltransferase family 39 protein [Steroidobacteraceae bacterium]
MKPAPPSTRDWSFRVLAALTFLCLALGILARFRGLGTWPLSVDEYYLAQSVQNILRSGLPHYACGGLYVRGLALQYGAALLQVTGLTPELAPRLIAALASLIELPGVYLLARRLGGRNIGLIAVALLAVSVWEVEVARFGRMYAPFQAIFVWYLVYFLAYTLDRKRSALWGMLGLSLLSVLVWEGGFFLTLANLLPPFIRAPSGRLSRTDWKYLALAALLCVPGYLLATVDLRAGGAVPTLPPHYQEPVAVHLSRLDLATMPWMTLHLHPLWMWLALLPAGAIAYALLTVLRARLAPLALLGLVLASLCALLQQFGLAVAIGVVLGLLSMLDWRVLFSSPLRAVPAAIAVCAAFWIAFGLATQDWHVAGLSPAATGLLLGYEFARFPDFVREVLAPWAHTVPHLGLALALLLAAACVRALRHPASSNAERVLLALLVILLLAASASHPPRHETRYVFFLYPLAVVLALVTIQRWMAVLLGATPAAAVATVLVAGGGFALSEDFRPWHLLHIDSTVVSFRLGMPPAIVEHYQSRSDMRGAARWLDEHVDRAHDTVINSFPGVDFYYPYSNFYYMNGADPRFESWSCQRGARERWSNLPLLYSDAALLAQVRSGHRVWIVAESSHLPEWRALLPRGDWKILWRSISGDITILCVNAAAVNVAGGI